MSASAGRILLIPKGAYEAGETYKMLDMVEYDDATWVAKRTNTNVTPTEGDDWMKMVSVAGAFTWEANSLLGAKNLLPFPYINMGEVKYGITHQAYNDGSVHVAGTCTSSTGYAIRLTEEYVEIPSEWIGKSFTISDGYTAAVTPALNIVLFDSGKNQLGRYYARTTDETFEIPSNAVYWRANISVAYQVTVDATLYPMLRLAEDTDSGYQPYAKTNRELTVDSAEQAEVDDITNVYGAKNLIPYPYNQDRALGNPYTERGITFTADKEGIVLDGDLTGTSTLIYRLIGSASTLVQQFCEILPNTEYIMSGCPQGANDAKCRYYITIYSDDGATSVQTVAVNEQDVKFKTVDTARYFRIVIDVMSGASISNLRFKPMFRLASVKDDTWRPYAKTNYELTSDKAEHSEVDYLANKSGAKQLIPFPYIADEAQVGEHESYGITYTVNEDGTVEVNGTATNDSTLNLYNCWGLNKTFSIENNKTYILRGTPEGGGADTYSIQIVRQKSGQTSKWVSETGNGITISVTDEFTSVGMRILIKNGITCDHLVFKPLLYPSEISNSEFAPYVMSNKELTAAVKCNERTAGTYTLQATVDANGAVTYNWVSST